MIKYGELLEKYGSPLYVYDQRVLENRCNDIKMLERTIGEALPASVSVSMHYSSKANNNPAVLKIVKNCGLKIDCMSPYELYIGQKCGFKPAEMLYVCNNISAEEMAEVKAKELLICLDSISQVETWGQNFPDTDIMVRINPGTTGVGHSQKVITSGKATKFGICEENLPLLFKVVERYNLNIIGTHQHLGSLFLNDKISNYIAGVKAGLRIVKNYFKDVQIIDLGGGFGVPYLPGETILDLDMVAKQLQEVLQDFVKEYPSVKEFKFEPGRYIPCEAGTIVGTVTAVKYENGTYWIGTDIGMNELVRPSMYDSYHEIGIPDSSGEWITANFVGNVCESGDILGKDRRVRMPKVGDPVIVYNAGAYGFSMASNYTGRTRPAEVMCDLDGNIKVIRNRESIEDMSKDIIW